MFLCNINKYRRYRTRTTYILGGLRTYGLQILIITITILITIIHGIYLVNKYIVITFFLAFPFFKGGGGGKGVFKGGFRGFKPPPEIFRFFLKSEGKEIERKRKKRMWGGGGVPS